MHISDQVKEVFAAHGWIYADFDGKTIATKIINFPHLAGQLSNGDRLVKLAMNETGRWLESVDGWNQVDACVDLRDYFERSGFEAVCDAIKKAFGASE